MSLAALEDTFRYVIVPDHLSRAGPEPQPQPEVILLGGQPGAGKSVTAEEFRRSFASRGGLVWVTLDDFRPYHPDYERLLAEKPADMPGVTRPAAQWWQDRAAAWLGAGRYNMLLEVGFRNPPAILASAGQFEATGYQVHVAALAVPAVLSRLGIIERYARQAEAAGAGRWTTAASHDGDYAGTVEVLRLAQMSRAVSHISLWTRDGLIHDDRRGPGGEWETGAAAVDVLAEARAAPLTRLQCAALSRRLADTVQRLERDGLAHQVLRDMAATVKRDLDSPSPARPDPTQVSAPARRPRRRPGPPRRPRPGPGGPSACT